MLLLLLPGFFLSTYARACWCALSSNKHGARSRVRDASHRRQHCCASIEDRGYCGVKLHLLIAARCSWLGVGMMVVWVPYYCSAAVCCLLLWFLLFCFCLCLCLLARIGVLGQRRGTALGHPCWMPPTGANIAVLLLKTWLAPDSTYT